MHLRALPALAALLLPAFLAAQEAPPPTPASIVAEAAAGEWAEIASNDLLVMELAPDAAGRPRRVVIQLLPPPFSQPWVENIKTLARAHWWDGTSVYRVVDNWVAQWGDGEDDDVGAKPLPDDLNVVPESDYSTRITEEDPLSHLRLSDAYAPSAIFRHGWPLGMEYPSVHSMDHSAWPVHCYAHVGVARNLSPDTGTGAELYAVIGHAPRQLDRNIAVVGRVIEGIEHLATLPRGTAEAGVYATAAEHTPVQSVRLASELPASEQPRFEYLASDSASFARYVAVRANRSDEFYHVPAGGVDVCNVQVPIRRLAPDAAPQGG
jgi:peptidylprolyl isomerase